MLILAATLAIQGLTSMAVLMPAVYVAVAAPDLGIDPSRIGIVMAVIYLAASVAAAAVGGVVRRHGALRVSQAALLLSGIGVALYATADLPIAAAGAILAGAGLGPVTPASAHLLIRRTPPHRRGLVFSLRQTGVPLGNALAGAVVPPLVLAFGWRGTSLLVGALCVALALAVQPLRAELDADADPAARSEGGVAASFGFLLRSPPLLRLALASVGFSSMQLCFSAFVVTFLTAGNGLSLATAGLILAVAQTTALLARILWGWIADRLVAPRALLVLLGVGMTASGAALALVTPSWPPALIAGLTVAIGATAIGWNGVLIAEVARLAPPGAAGAATGGVLSVTFLGAVIAPTLFGAIVEWSGGYRLSFLAAAAVAGLGAVALGRGR